MQCTNPTVEHPGFPCNHARGPVKERFVVQIDEDHNPSNPSFFDRDEFETIEEARRWAWKLAETSGQETQIVRRVDEIVE